MTRVHHSLSLSRHIIALAILVLAPWGCAGETESDTAHAPLPAGMEWVPIAGGTFSMGSLEWADEQPVHPVTVPDFQMNRTEITVAQYRECVAVNACTEPDAGGAYENWNQPGFDDHPVNAVDYFQARAFCNWVGGDLPSESMWEYAARSGGRAQAYPWGNEAPTCDRATMDSDEQVDGCGTERTWPVCSRLAGNTAQGLCDMVGNVWEWVLDPYHGTYDCDVRPTAYNCTPGSRAPSDGTPWGESGDLIVERGGSFNSDAFYLRASTRLRVTPTKRSYGLGFRCVR